MAPTVLAAGPDDFDSGELFGGYTAKQRLREEIESPFRKVRIFFFGASTASALLALYFSGINVLKGTMGGFSDTPPLDESLVSCAINIAAVIGCAAITYNDYNASQKSLERIAKGGALAALVLQPASGPGRKTLKDLRRDQRVLIAAGGRDYVQTLARSLTCDQRADANTLPALLESVDVTVVPVLLEGKAGQVGDTGECWRATAPRDEELDRNFDIDRANQVVAFPCGASAWAQYLASEVETAASQGFDAVEKGLTITVKKNGRILRRATGQPQWNGMIGTMEVMDGSKFGMPGDDEKYYGK